MMQNELRKDHTRVIREEFYKVTKILPEIYRITSAENVYMELFVGEKKALLLDTGYGYGDLRGIVRKITDKPLIVVNSHGHLDHTCGNFQFAEDIYIHPKDMELCRVHNTQAERIRALEVAKQTVDDLTDETYNMLPLDFDEAAYLKADGGKLIPLAEGMVFALGGITLEVVELPGHTAGSIGLFYREKKILYTGDSINASLWLFMPEALSLSDYRETLAKAAQIDFEKMIQSHNDRIEPREVMRYYIDAAEHVDLAQGIPFQSPLTPGVDARVCMRPGMQMANIKDPDFAAIVTNEEHLR